MSRIPSFRGAGEAFLRVENLSTATTLTTVSYDQAGALLLYNGQAGPARIMLPQAERGLIFRIALADQSVSSAILVGATSGTAGAQDIRYKNTTGGYVQCGSTADSGSLLTFVGVNDSRYDVFIARASTIIWASTSTGA